MQMEPQEAVDKLRQTVRVLSAFKNYYFDNKARTLEETPKQPLEIPEQRSVWPAGRLP